MNFDEVKDEEPFVLINEDLIVTHKHDENCHCDEEVVIEETKEEKKRLPKMYPVGLVHGTFIICQNEEGMYLVDEHAAEERINLEKIQKQMREENSVSMNLLIPITIELTNAEFIIINENLDVLRNLGIGIEIFGATSIIIKSHPSWIKTGYEESVLRRIVETVIKEEKNFDLEKFRESIAAMAACKMSVRANTNISLAEMQQIMDDLSKCDNPFNCAHGRPTIIHYPKYELEKLFKRVM